MIGKWSDEAFDHWIDQWFGTLFAICTVMAVVFWAVVIWAIIALVAHLNGG